MKKKIIDLDRLEQLAKDVDKRNQTGKLESV